MSLEMLVSKYIASAEKVLSEMRPVHGSVVLSEEGICEIVEYVSAYLKIKNCRSSHGIGS